MADLISTNASRIHNVLEYGRTSASIIHGRLGAVYSKHTTFIVTSVLLAYMMLLTCVGFIMVTHLIRIKNKGGCTSNHHGLGKVAVEQAHVMPCKGAKWEFHGLFGYGFTVEFSKVGGTALSLSSTSYLHVRINTQARLHAGVILCSKVALPMLHELLEYAVSHS